MKRTKNQTVYDVFIERGFIEKVTDEEKVPEVLEGKATCYIGFDPTASSFHVGNLVPIMPLLICKDNRPSTHRLSGRGDRAGGDPSGKNEMRQILTYEEIAKNGRSSKETVLSLLRFL